MVKNTGELLEQLSSEKVEYKDFVDDANESFIDNNLKEYWLGLLEKSEVNKSDVINRSDIGYTYFYDIIRGDKCPSRDKIIRLLLAMELSLDECQSTLKLYKWGQLYARDKRDSAIIYAFNHKMSVWQLNDLMTTNSIEVLK